jgi:uncharacterized pyridoxamine 5'-phosphate oxidase family protein
MPQPPQPKPVDPAELPQLAQATMKAAKFPMLATVDGDQPRLRPVSPVRTDGFVVYVANLRRYGKTHELEANPKAELCYKDDQDNQVRITAQAEIVTDRPAAGGNLGRQPAAARLPRQSRQSRADHLPLRPQPRALHARVGAGVL